MNRAEKVAIGKTKLKVTRLGLGTGLLGAVHDDGPWSEIIKTAWDAGRAQFRHVSLLRIRDVGNSAWPRALEVRSPRLRRFDQGRQAAQTRRA